MYRENDMKARYEERFDALKAELGKVGYFRRGSVQCRTRRQGKADGGRKAGPPKLHVAYYEWTRKVKGKTVTVHLTQEQADLLRQWIANARQLDKIIAEMQSVSFHATERLLQAAGRASEHS
jgi:hypothetical protein